MYEVAIVIFLLLAIAIVALILVQQGKGAGMGASFGAGASNTVFGSVGSGNFLTKSTWVLSILFFAVCLFIGWMQKDSTAETDSFSNITASQEAAEETKEGDAKEAAAAAGGDDVPALDSDGQGSSNPEVPFVGSDVPAVGEE